MNRQLKHLQHSIAFGLSIVCASTLAETWSDASGSLRVEGEFIGVDGRDVVLRELDGTTTKVPIEKLSSESRTLAKQRYLEKQSANATPGKLTHQTYPQAPREEPQDEIAKNKRWKLNFVVADKKNYAKLLDHFKLEIASIQAKSNDIEYMAKVSSKSPQVRQGKIENELRQPYLIPEGDIQAYHRELHESAGLTTEARRFVVLIDPELNGYLTNLELIQLKRNGYDSLNAVQSTEFTLEHDGYEFGLAVSEQEYRLP